MADVAVQIAGWFGSALLVLSLLQSRMYSMRVLNLIAAVVLIGYNTVLAVWASVAMNVAVAAIDVFYLVVWRRQQVREPKERVIEDRRPA